MKAQQLIENASYSPETLRIVCQAFDEAWAGIAGNFGDDPQTVAVARLKLARTILSFPHDKIRDVEQIKNSSLEVMALLHRTRTGAGLMRK